MDPWYPLGSGDMLEVAQMGLHVAQMTSQARHARLLRRGDRERRARAGPGRLRHRASAAAPTACCCRRARPIEAIRLRADRLWVVRRGKVIARASRAGHGLDLPGRPAASTARPPLIDPASRAMAGAASLESIEQGPRAHETHRIAHQPLRAQGAHRDGRKEARLPAQAGRRVGHRRDAQGQPAGQGALPGDGRWRGGVRFARHRRIPRHAVAGGQADPGHRAASASRCAPGRRWPTACSMPPCWRAWSRPGPAAAKRSARGLDRPPDGQACTRALRP